jgi:hypothetical protein
VNLPELSEDVFLRVVDNYEQVGIEQKPRLTLPNEEARGDFIRVVSGIGNAGGGWIVFGPHVLSEWSASVAKVYDPSSLSNTLTAIQPAPRLAVHLRDTSRGRFVLLKIDEPIGRPYLVARDIGKLPRGALINRVNTSSRIVTDSSEAERLWRRWCLQVDSAESAPISAGRRLWAYYAGRSADVIAPRGVVQEFAVFYANVGADTWVKGGQHEARLERSHFEDHRELPSFPEAIGRVLAAQRQDAVATGELCMFNFNVVVPATATAPGYTFFVHPVVGNRQIGVDIALSFRVAPDGDTK